ncbi:hypothetical protein AAFF_G00273790 [Aldrovandia affinis]|uniref:Uncharacterized protein n=1 Tax=Aldrovandia affinis TaxID=143900 RepID=A0AAD7SRJ0_9TELE|nr:hypothetical protein AAFF_G00273790 [Aldrovandia affinis]
MRIEILTEAGNAYNFDCEQTLHSTPTEPGRVAEIAAAAAVSRVQPCYAYPRDPPDLLCLRAVTAAWPQFPRSATLNWNHGRDTALKGQAQVTESGNSLRQESPDPSAGDLPLKPSRVR